MALNVFISHAWANKDCDQMKRLEFKLRTDGHSVWVDTHNMQSGDRLLDKIKEGIQQSDVVLVMWSVEAVLSETIKKEIAMAQEMDKHLFFLLIDEYGEMSDKTMMNNYLMLNFIDDEVFTYTFPVLNGHLMDIEFKKLLIEIPSDTIEIQSLIAENEATLTLFKELYNHYVRMKTRNKNASESKNFVGFIQMQLFYFKEMAKTSDGKSQHWKNTMSTFSNQVIDLLAKYPKPEQNEALKSAFYQTIKQVDPNEIIPEFDAVRKYAQSF